MCQHCHTTNTHKNAQPQGVINRISHITSAVNYINQAILGFHRAETTGVFTLTYAYEINNSETNELLQFLRFDVTALEDNTFEVSIADRDNNVLYDVTFKNALEVHEFIKSMVDIKSIPLPQGETPVTVVNLAIKNGFEENRDAMMAHLVEQDKTALTVYLGLGGLVIDRHLDTDQGGHVH